MVISDGEGETDDDFHTTPPEPPRIPRMPTEGPNPAIKLRGGPKELVTLVASLTQRQRQDVISIGMEGLLSLQVTEMPQLLGHWLVAHFEPATMSLKLGNGRYISITAQDVAHVLGLPNGPVPITERDGQLVGTELRAWREETKQRKGKITVKVLAAQSRKHGGGGEWFRRHFSVIVVTTIIASVSNGYANQKTVHMFHDFDRIKDLDWCTYLLRSLVDTRGSWSQDAPRKYTGPLLFLTVSCTITWWYR